MHEVAEATMMRGCEYNLETYNLAHVMALLKYGVSPFSVYAPEVIMQMPECFGTGWKKFWGIEQ